MNQNRKTSAEKNSAVSILRNATRNPTATRLPVAFVVNFFNRRESILRHRALPERPEVRPRMLIKSPASNSPAKRPPIHSPQSSNNPSVEPNTLPEDSETRILYLRHWNTIQTQKNSGNRVQNRYIFTLNDITSSTFPEMVRNIFTQQTSAFRINVSFGFILRNVETAELRYFHPSQNNARFFDVPHLIRNEEDIQKYLDELSCHDILEYIRQQRPDNKWVLHPLTNVTFYVNKFNEHPIGASVLLPDYILKSPGVQRYLSVSTYSHPFLVPPLGRLTCVIFSYAQWSRTNCSLDCIALFLFRLVVVHWSVGSSA